MDSKETVKSPQRLPSMDGMRAVSILLVLYAHASESQGFPESLRHPLAAQFAALGVRVFFVLSGFIITHLLIRELTLHRKVSLIRFYMRRCTRILPPLFVLIAATTAVDYLISDLGISPRHVLAALTFTIPVFPWNDGSWALGHIWSLSVEEHFYLIWPFVVAFGGMKVACRFGVAMLLLMPLVRTMIYMSGHMVFLSTYVGCGDLMMFGCLAATIRDRQPELVLSITGKNRELYRILSINGIIAVTILSGTAGFGTLTIPFGPTIAGILIAYLILSYTVQNGGLGHSMLNHSWLIRLGVLSYSLYLWQQMFLFPKTLSTRWWQAFPVNIVLATVAAWLSYAIVENQSRKFRKYLAV